MPNLTIREKGAETVFQVSETAATIGRGEHNDVRVQDPRASKEHCRIVEQGGRWKLVDLESHNGTRVNGAFRNKAWLGHGDTITIGQSEIRFGLEGKSRTRAAPARPETDDEAPPPRRYRSGGGGEKLLIFGGAVLGVVLVFAFVFNMASGIAPDEHNARVKQAAERLVENGQYDEAQQYLMKHADPDGALYETLMDRVRELEVRKPKMQLNVREREAHTLLSRMANKIANYNRGGSADPAEILRMMKQLKTEYAGTEQDLAAAQTYPAFYAGTVPEPGINRSNPRRKLKKEWAEVCEQAEGYRKQEHFREARETLERFVRVRESTLEQVDLDWLNTELAKRVGNIERLAGTYFSSTERRARDLVKKKRYDQAIALYLEEAKRNEPGGKKD
ncbi:MAG: FHA domain-containing protein [Planctomycetota bacterium]